MKCCASRTTCSVGNMLRTVALVVCEAALSALAMPAQALPTTGDFAGLVGIGDHRNVYLECSGRGAPTVVLISGKGNRADTWSTAAPDMRGPTVFSAIAKFTRVCAYDRPGTVGALASEPSRSDPVPLPVTAGAGAADLQALLTAAKVPGPYVLVGHSMGGLIARLFAAEDGDEVAGLVLEDALSEDLYSGLSADQRAVFEKLNGAPENYDNAKSFEEIRAAPPVRPMPVIVLTAGLPQLTPQVIASGQLPPEVTQSFADALWAAQMQAQDHLAALFPSGRHVVVANSTHYIHVDQPQLVIDAIREVVDAVRVGKTGLRPQKRSPSAFHMHC
ncbi:MAG TPA: alpha/beta hydrolase [Candidatus Baltobacteraceae bacterium]|nr:alpha/beta hydrolase [Candidatus Baltobacteraceae bacterium]